MYNRDFLKYFRINKFFLQFCGVMPFLTWGFFVNGIFMLMPICTCLFLTLPGFYIMISRLKIMATTKILNIFCDLIEILVVAFQGIFYNFCCCLILGCPLEAFCSTIFRHYVSKVTFGQKKNS